MAEENEASSTESLEKKDTEKIEREPEEGIVEERVYVVPLRKAWVAPRGERAPKAIRILRRFIERHMKTESVIISNEVNEAVWRRGIEKPPRKIRVRALKDEDGNVTVKLAGGD